MSDTVAAVLGSEPDWDALPDGTSTAVRLLLQRCLEKDPKRRLRDLGDVHFEIDDLRGVATTRDRSSRARRALPAAAIALVLLAGGAALFYSVKPSVAVTSPSEYEQLTNFTDSVHTPSLSPDGQMVTFKRGGDSFLGAGQIFVKLLPNGESVQLTTSPGQKYGPVFTPDGTRVTYTNLMSGEWDTWTVPVHGGQPLRLLPNASGLTWIADHQVLFSEIKSGLHMGIVTATDSRAAWREIWLAPLDRRTPPRLIESGDHVSFGAPGELVFQSLAQGNALARIKTDGTGFERIPTVSFLDKGDVSPTASG